MEMMYWGSKDEQRQITAKNRRDVERFLNSIFEKQPSNVYVVLQKTKEVEDDYNSFFVSTDFVEIKEFIENQFEFLMIDNWIFSIHGFETYTDSLQFLTDLKEGC